MNYERINYILNNDNKFDIQELDSNNQKAKIGFVDNFEERDVFIKDLYENL